MIGLFFFYLSLLVTDKFVFAFELYPGWKEHVPDFIIFLNPVHKPNYLGEAFLTEFKLSNSFYIFDFLGRIFVGYGLYQTAQAFRKYR